MTGSERRHRPWWPTALAAAVAVAVVILVVTVPNRGGHDAPDSSSTSRAPAGDDKDWQWVSYRDVEVRAPATWQYAYEASRPDCIIDPHDRKDPWARDVPTARYVVVGTPSRPVPAIGCIRKPQPGDPPRAFGEVPFVLWQPYVKLDLARPDLDAPDRDDGNWEYHGWHLTRTTVGDVQVAVLAPPGESSLATSVLDSTRHVKTTALGCETESEVQAERFVVPSGPPIPAAHDVAAVTICAYGRQAGHPGLEGSRRLTGEGAHSLVAAILSAPTGGGPDNPRNCMADMYGDHALALRFFGSDRDTKAPLAQAYVYYDWCFGNGIVDAKHSYRLTRADCAPLFAEPPIGFWEGTMRLYAACSSSP